MSRLDILLYSLLILSYHPGQLRGDLLRPPRSPSPPHHNPPLTPPPVNPETSTSSDTTSTTTQPSSVSLNPIITSWKKSTGFGYNGYRADVEAIYYTSTNVYIVSNSIPSYSIGPWIGSPAVPQAKNFVAMFPLSPSVSSSSTKIPTQLGPNGLMKNGVAFYNAMDGYSFNNLGVWHRNAFYWEYVSFDSCSGHPDQGGVYHHHSNPVCLYNQQQQQSSSTHSLLIGWAFDGFPIYGPFGYSSPYNSSSSIKRMATSYRLRNISDRTSLANGTVLTSRFYGPVINATYPLGSYIEDYEYTSGYGDVDEYNGRWCVTPDYPNGTYAYFIPTNSSNLPEYPYTIGPYYKGNVFSTLTNNSIPTNAIKYFSYN